MTPPIHTVRLVLRPVTGTDRDELHSLEQDPEVMRFLNGGQATPLAPDAGAAPFLMPRGGEPGVWAAREKESGGFVG